MHIQIDGGEVTIASPFDDMSPTTHGAGYDILNEFFGEAAIGPGPMSDVEGPIKWPAFTAESTHGDEVLEHTVRSVFETLLPIIVGRSG
jgi:hypothetical protein